MKKTLCSIFVLCTTVLLCSCGVSEFRNLNSSGTVTHVELSNANFRVVKNVEGYSSATYILGIGGLSRNAVRDNAVSNMFKNAGLSDSQTITNVYIKCHRASILGIYVNVSYSAFGQVIEFISDNADRRSEGRDVKTEISMTGKVSESPYAIGDIYDNGTKRGVVFETFENGLHGKIVYPKLMEAVRWCINDMDDILVDSLSDGDGEQNMAIVRQIPDWKSKYPAFAKCAELGNDWYLPAADELDAIYRNRKKESIYTIIKSVEDAWSSTCAGQGKAKSMYWNMEDVSDLKNILAVARF